ncbi:YybS family protein [Planomicrobium okeanokoites]|uniref:YybS family protein n=1 Tax=Planomicrobium okeanokoites TaxID=244 RepID=UPI0024919E13|nr:YybS family protein [Planomicrobium okeanokoites]
MQNQRTRQITNGALMAAVFTVLMAITVYVPIISLATLFFLALPVAWYSAKYPWKPSALFSLATFLLSLIIGGVFAVPVALLYIPFGLMIGLSIHYGKSKLFLFMGSSIVWLISVMVQYVAMIWLFGINVIEEYLTASKATLRNGSNWMERLGGTEEQIEQYNESVGNMLTTFETTLPALIILSVFVIVWFHLLINLPILKRLGTAIPKFPPFADMKLPKSVLWYYLIVLLISLLSEFEPGTIAFLAFANAMVLLQMLLFLQGIAFYHFYIQQEGWPNWVKVIVTVFAFPLQAFTIIVGIVDLGFDIRGWVKKAHDFKGK